MYAKNLIHGTLRPETHIPDSGARNWRLESDLSHSVWGNCQWQSLDDVCRRMMSEYRRQGYEGYDSTDVAYLETFFPDAGPQGPFFQWVIKKPDGRLFLYQGYYAFCPFPTVRDTQLLRDLVQPGDELFVPKPWAEAAEGFAERGFALLKGDRKSGTMSYTAIHWNGAGASLSECEVYEFLPKTMRPALAAAA